MIKFIYMLKIHMKQNNINFYSTKEKVHFYDSQAFIEYSNDMEEFTKTLKNTTQIKNVKY